MGTVVPDHQVTAVQAEGARVGFACCNKCGAAILLDPRDVVDFYVVHEEWHRDMEKKR